MSQATEHIMQAVEHVTQATEHIMQAAEHVTQATEHIMQAVEHVTQATEHIMQAAEHVTQATEHIMQAVEHVTQATEHIMQAAEHTKPVSFCFFFPSVLRFLCSKRYSIDQSHLATETAKICSTRKLLDYRNVSSVTRYVQTCNNLQHISLCRMCKLVN